MTGTRGQKCWMIHVITYWQWQFELFTAAPNLCFVYTLHWWSHYSCDRLLLLSFVVITVCSYFLVSADYRRQPALTIAANETMQMERSLLLCDNDMTLIPTSIITSPSSVSSRVCSWPAHKLSTRHDLLDGTPYFLLTQLLLHAINWEVWLRKTVQQLSYESHVGRVISAFHPTGLV